MGIVFGALTSLSIGLSELFGRRVLNVRGPIVTGAVIQLVAIFTSLAALGVVSSRFVVGDFSIGLMSGVGLGVGLWGYFSGLERSSSAVVAPIVATMSAVIPYGYAVVRGAAPAPLAVVGALVAVAGLVLITLGGQAAGLRAGIRWGAVSGAGYGIGLSVIIDADEASGAWPSVGQRVAAFALMVVFARRGRLDWRPPRGVRATALISGVFAGLSTLFFLFGVQADATSAVVMASLFPAVSVVVGRVAYGDDVGRRQVIGIAIVLVGVVGLSLAA